MTLPAGQFIGVMPARYIGDVLALGDAATENQIEAIYDLSQRKCPPWPIISSLHDLTLIVMGRKPKPVYQVNYVLREMEGGHQFHTYLYRPLTQRRSVVRFFADGFRNPGADPSRHLAVVVHKNTGLAHLMVGSKFEGILVERASNNTGSSGGVNIMTRFFQPDQDTATVNFFGHDFGDSPTALSVMNPQRAVIADKALGILNRIIDGKTVSHCQEVGILQAIGLAKAAGYGCDASAEELQDHTDARSTACGAGPKRTLGAPQPVTVRGLPVAGARAFAIDPVWAISDMFRSRKGMRR